MCVVLLVCYDLLESLCSELMMSGGKVGFKFLSDLLVVFVCFDEIESSWP